MKTRLNDLFDEMEREEGNKLDDKIQIEEDSRSEEIFENYKKILSLKKTTWPHKENSVLRNTSAKDVTKFVLYMHNKKEALETEFGPYLTHLIQYSGDQQHTIHLSKQMCKINSLGYENREKIITIFGDVGSYLGESMISGKIILNGKAGIYPGINIKGGEILINGRIKQKSPNHISYDYLPGCTRITPK